MTYSGHASRERKSVLALIPGDGSAGGCPQGAMPSPHLLATSNLLSAVASFVLP